MSTLKAQRFLLQIVKELKAQGRHISNHCIVHFKYLKSSFVINKSGKESKQANKQNTPQSTRDIWHVILSLNVEN